MRETFPALGFSGEAQYFDEETRSAILRSNVNQRKIKLYTLTTQYCFSFRRNLFLCILVFYYYILNRSHSTCRGTLPHKHAASFEFRTVSRSRSALRSVVLVHGSFFGRQAALCRRLLLPHAKVASVRTRIPGVVMFDVRVRRQFPYLSESTSDSLWAKAGFQGLEKQCRLERAGLA